MKSPRFRQVVRRVLGVVCVPLLVSGFLLAQQPPPQPPGPQAPAARLSPPQLDTLVAPVALYPDRLLSQILVASTYPLEVAEAAQWVQQNPGVQGSQLVDAARQQNWDPSVQALVVFPDVLTRLSSDIRWTTDLGNAFLAQQADVMNAVQRMRAQAQASGKLRSNAQQTVTAEQQGDQTAIDIQPANPDEVYVPYYNPEYIWGPPTAGYYPPWDYLDIGYGYGYGFGPGVYIGGFFGGLGWGGWGWWPNWFRCSIGLNGFFFNHFGFRGYGFGGVGFARTGIWAHNAAHRLGVAYPNGALRGRYGAVSAASARSNYAASANRYNAAPRTSTAAGGWNRFGQSGSNRSTPAYGNSSGYRGSYGANGASGYRASPSYGYRSSPSYSRSYTAPSSRSYSSGSSRGYSSGGSRSYSSGGSRSSSSGGSHFGGGGGGGFHSSGGGGHGGGGHR